MFDPEQAAPENQPESAAPAPPLNVEENADLLKEKKEEHINLKVVGNDNNEVFFKIKRSTHFKKLMDAYCTRQGKTTNSVRFLYDGERLEPSKTPHDVGMEDGDSIDVMVEQVGGRVRLFPEW